MKNLKHLNIVEFKKLHGVHSRIKHNKIVNFVMFILYKT